jgi:glyoxalase family protein
LTSAVAYAVPAAALDFWRARLNAHGVAFAEAPRLGDAALAFTDFDGLPLELVGTAGLDPRPPAPHPEVPPERGLRGFHSVTLAAGSGEPTARVLTQDMDYQLVSPQGTRTRYAPAGGGPGTFVDLLVDPDERRGHSGVGTVHHVAFRTPDDASQREARAELVARGFGVSPIMDRCYFHSIYYREPNGVLFEIATDGPGFTIDEPIGQLGGKLQLPPWQEPSRATIEAHLPPLD